MDRLLALDESIDPIGNMNDTWPDWERRTENRFRSRAGAPTPRNSRTTMFHAYRIRHTFLDTPFPQFPTEFDPKVASWSNHAHRIV
jgi:hypothetical protein